MPDVDAASHGDCRNGINRRLSAAAREANRGSYADGNGVREYLADPYHVMRRRIAARLLAGALHRDGGQPTGPVLELGAGSMTMLDCAADPAHPVILADLAFEALRSGGPAGAGAICLDVTRALPVGDATVAAVVMGEVIEHVYDPRALLHECHRVLKPAGWLVVTTPNLAALQDRWRFLRGHSPRHVDPLHPYLWLHIRPFTASLLRLALLDASFQITDLRSNYVVWRLASGRWLRWRTPARLAPGLGGSLIMMARKR